ncbi:hypothetical protein HDU77_005689, partial [Chytriomyces hyalinus]
MSSSTSLLLLQSPFSRLLLTEKTVEDYIGTKSAVYFPLLYTVFHIILFSNLLGLTPYSTTATAELFAAFLPS